MINFISQINNHVNNFVWGPAMLILMLGTGLYFTIKTDFLQFKKFFRIFNETLLSIFKKDQNNDDGSISPFQALTTALASSVGTGNIVGVATAIAIGGPGAVFWIWVSAILGMMTKYAEILLAMKYRVRNDEGNFVGGPMYYLTNGLNMKFLGKLFAIFGLFASFGIGNMTQINSISTAAQSSLGIRPAITGVVIAIAISFIIVGGVQRIAKITEKLVPYMIVFFVFITFCVLFSNAKNIPDALKLIFTHAFSKTSAVGGFVGSTLMNTIKIGISRGVFTNEAGLGSSPIAHAASCTKEPVKQAMWGMLEVFIDTILMCTCTALVLITTDVWHMDLTGIDMNIAAFATVFPNFAPHAITISIFCFAFATLISWSYYGEKCIEFLVGSSSLNVIYKLIYSAIIVVGATSDVTTVWKISDSLNGLMAIPNLIGILGLSSIVIKSTKSYFKK